MLIEEIENNIKNKRSKKLQNKKKREKSKVE